MLENVANAFTTRPEPGIRARSGGCPPAGSSPTPSAPLLQKLTSSLARAQDFGMLPSPATMTTATPPTVALGALPRKHRVARGNDLHQADMEASSIAEVTAVRPGRNSYLS